MAYAATLSTANAFIYLDNLVQLKVLPKSLQTMDLPSDEIEFITEVIENLYRSRSKRVKGLDGRIRDALYGLEDVILSFASEMILTAQSDPTLTCYSKCVRKLRQGFGSFAKKVRTIKKDNRRLINLLLDEEEDDDDDDGDSRDEGSSRIDFGGEKLKIVGFSDELTRIKHQLNAAYRSSALGVVSFVGVPGTGRTTFARTVFSCPDAAKVFELRAWVSVGPKYELRQILYTILSQIDDDHHKLFLDKGDEEMFKYLNEVLWRHKYLIVLDDVRHTRVWEYLRKLFPDKCNGSRVLLTTHLQEVALFAKSLSIHSMPVLNKEEIWNLLSRVILPEQNSFPPELEKAGKKIAKNCEGLVVEAAKYADILSKVDPTPEHWNRVASQASANDAYDEILEVSKIIGDDHGILSTHGYGDQFGKMLGLPHAVEDIMMNVFSNEVYPSLKVVAALVGMAGIGKTALARKIFEDPWTICCYYRRVWITVGPKYDSERAFENILAQLEPNIHNMRLSEDWETMEQHFKAILSSKRLFIVFDDVWDEIFWSDLKNILPDMKCDILLTTRLMEGPLQFLGESGKNRIHEMKLLNKEESWSLLRDRVFGEMLFPRELEKPGKLIAENCDGLPLMIVTVASLLSEAQNSTLEYWDEVAKMKNSVFEQAYQKISKTLYLSYKGLDNEYRACFLYMAAFRLKYKISNSKLFMLSDVEGFLEPYSCDNLREFESNYFGHLVSNNLVLVHDRKYNGQTKTCRLHSVFWHFCVGEARNDKFLHVVNCYADGLSQFIQKQRRLCIQNNVLFAIKDVYDSMVSTSSVRSLLCFGPPHQYQVPICFELKLLNIIDALTIRFYELPIEVVDLVLLKYLALTCNGNLPASISKLWNLEFLIIHRHTSIKFPGDLSYLPMEIWDMKLLKHLHIMGSNLPVSHVGHDSEASLANLSTLLDVRPESLTKNILERIHNLQKLGIRIELAPDASEPLFSFDHLSILKKLESLKCVVVNPELRVSPPAPFSKLPSGLIKLSLSGTGYGWEEMRPIALLPHLQELKLQRYAFRGSEWVVHEKEFVCLEYLLVEDTDLVHWRADDFCYLQSLQSVVFRHCYLLKDIPWHSVPRSCKAHIVDCNPSLPVNNFARVYSSWEAEKL